MIMSTSITPTELKDKLSQKKVCLLDVRSSNTPEQFSVTVPVMTIRKMRMLVAEFIVLMPVALLGD